MRCSGIVYTEHAAERAVQRSVTDDDIRAVVERGIVSEIAEDTPGRVYVMEGDVSGRRLRVVLRRDDADICYVITVFPVRGGD